MLRTHLQSLTTPLDSDRFNSLPTHVADGLGFLISSVLVLQVTFNTACFRPV